jgi:hypothetical protein
MVQRITAFDLWQTGYGGAELSVYVAGTTTLASLFTDYAMTTAAANPQTLLSRSDEDGVNYGKFESPIYLNTSYTMAINTTEETGVIDAPITSLSGQNMSDALITVQGGVASTAKAIAGRTVHAQNYGTISTGESGSASTNTATINLAIAALASGGSVILPAGIINHNQISLPEGIVLKGQGREVTTLRSVLGDKSFIINGNRAGFADITVDGASLTSNSVGIYSVNNDEIDFNNVMVKRFNTGVVLKGGTQQTWIELHIENCVTNIKLHGDTDAGGSMGGGAISDILWVGGAISVGSTTGLDISYEDARARNLKFVGVGFKNCAGKAVKINGGQFVNFEHCWWEGNTNDITIQDDTASLTGADYYNNKVINVQVKGGRMNGGTVIVTGTAQEVIFDGVDIADVDFTPTTPINNFIQLVNCTEDSAVTIGGEATKLIRTRTSINGEAFGLTTAATATKAWSIALDAGQLVHVEGRVIGKQRNGEGRAIYHISCGAYREGSELAYDTQTANFTVGNVLTGASSGATARIVADSDSGTTGTLTLTDIVGIFTDNEIITDGGTGSATVNGALTHANVTLDGVGNVAVRTAYETDSTWACAFAANGQELELKVTGASGATVEWTANVTVVTT